MGIGVRDFWDLTPTETYQAIEVAVERETRVQKRELAQAWWSAAFVRAKRLPPLRQVLNTAPAKPLRGSELAKRRKEFDDMRKALDVSKLKVPTRG